MDRYSQKVQLKAAAHRRLLEDVKDLAVSVNRCQETLTSLMAELTAANAKFQGERNTQQEVDYLTILLACAKRKLSWEKQIASLHKRVPGLLEEMTGALNDQDFPPSNEIKLEMMQSLQVAQAALARLQLSPQADASNN